MTLYEGFSNVGSHRLTVDGSDLSSGIYIIKFTAGNQIQNQKVALIK